MHSFGLAALISSLALVASPPIPKAVAPAPTSSAKEAASPKGEDLVTFFYATNRADLLPQMLLQLDKDGLLGQESSREALGAFLSVLFRRPDVRAEAIVEGARVGNEGRETLLYALWLAGEGAAASRIARSRQLSAAPYSSPAPDLLAMPLTSAESLDMQWGAFMASGDVRYPRRLIDLLDAPASKKGGVQQKLLLGAARWSLASNAKQHQPVLALVRDEAGRRTGPAKAVLEEILEESSSEQATSPPALRPMTKVVTRQVYPAPPAGSFGAKPTTLYRMGDRYARLEEEPDPERGIHGLVVVAEPKVWIVNLADRTARFIVDPGPTYVFHAPVYCARCGQGGDDKHALRDLELGKELEFLRAHSAKASPVTLEGKSLEALAAIADGYLVTLVTEPGGGQPRRIKIEQEGKAVFELEYLEHRTDLPADMDLFSPPAGVRITPAD